MKTSRHLFWVSAAVIVADQISKFAVLRNIEFRQRINVIPDFFDLTLLYNPGAAFSFLADAGGWQKYFFLILALIICAYLVYAVAGEQFGRLGSWGAVLIVGGAVGNVIDRLIHHQVVDFLLFYWRDWYYPAFNIADSCICLGVFLMIADSFKNPKKSARA